MKKTYFILFLGWFVHQSYAQCNDKTIVNVDNRPHFWEDGYYYKDINNILNAFEGTYKYESGGIIFELTLVKKEGSALTNNSCEDLLVGGYRYVKDGVEKINTLNELNTPQTNGRKYSVSGNFILTGQTLGCDDCGVDEKWINAGISDNRHAFNFHLKRRVENGQQVLKVLIIVDLNQRIKYPNQPDLPPIKCPIGEFTLIKQ